MPYNVICLACTVNALAFGPLHNITTKGLVIKREPEKPGIVGQVLGKVKVLKSLLGRNKTDKQVKKD